MDYRINITQEGSIWTIQVIEEAEDTNGKPLGERVVADACTTRVNEIGNITQIAAMLLRCFIKEEVKNERN